MKAQSKPWFFGSPFPYFTPLQYESKSDIISFMKEIGDSDDLNKITKYLLIFYQHYEEKNTDELLYKNITRCMIKLVTQYAQVKQTQHIVLQFLHAVIIDLSRKVRKTPENVIYILNHLTVFTSKCDLPITQPLISHLLIVKASAFNYLRKPEPALSTLEEAYKLDPKGLDEGLSVNINLAYAYQYSYRYKEALPHAKYALQAFTYLPNHFSFMFKGNKISLCKVILSHLFGLIYCGLKTSTDSVFIWYNYFDECLQNAITYFRNDKQENIFDQPIIAWAFRQLQLAEDLARRLYKDFKGYIENGKYKRLNDFIVQKYGSINNIDNLKIKSLDDLAEHKNEVLQSQSRQNSQKHQKRPSQKPIDKQNPFNNELKINYDEKLFRSGRLYTKHQYPIARASTLDKDQLKLDSSPILDYQVQIFRTRSQLKQHHDLQHQKTSSPTFDSKIDKNSAIHLLQFKYESIIPYYQNLLTQHTQNTAKKQSPSTILQSQIDKYDDFNAQNIRITQNLSKEDKELNACVILQNYYRDKKNRLDNMRKTRLQLIQYKILVIQQFARGKIYQQRYKQNLQQIAQIQSFFNRFVCEKLKKSSIQSIIKIQKMFRGRCVRREISEFVSGVLTVQRAFLAKFEQKTYQKKKNLAMSVQRLARYKQMTSVQIPARNASIMIQKFYRRNAQILALGERKNALQVVQSTVAGYMQQMKFRLKIRAIMKIQTVFRGFKARQWYLQVQVSAVVICKFYKSKVCSTAFLEARTGAIYIQRFYQDDRFCQVVKKALQCGYLVKSAFQMRIAISQQNKIEKSALFIQNIIKGLQDFRKYKQMLASSLFINKIARSLIERNKFECKDYAPGDSSRASINKALYEQNSGSQYLVQREKQIEKQACQAYNEISKNIQVNKYQKRNYYFAPQITICEGLPDNKLRQNASFYEIVIDNTEKLNLQRTEFPVYLPLKSEMIKQNAKQYSDIYHPALQKQKGKYLRLQSDKLAQYYQVKRPDYVNYKLKDTFKKGKIDTWTNQQRNNYYKSKEERFSEKQKENHYQKVIPRFYSSSNLLAAQLTTFQTNQIFDSLLSDNYFKQQLSVQEIQNIRKQNAQKDFLTQVIDIKGQKQILIDRLKQMPQKNMSQLVIQLVQASDIKTVKDLQKVQTVITKENSIYDSLGSQLKQLQQDESLASLSQTLQQKAISTLQSQRDTLIHLLNQYKFTPSQFIKFIDQFAGYSEQLLPKGKEGITSKVNYKKLDPILPYQQQFTNYQKKHYISPKNIINLINIQIYPISLRTKIIQNKQATIFIQKVWRMKLAFILVQQKNKIIQLFQAFALHWIQKNKQVKLQKSVIIIQSFYRQIYCKYNPSEIGQIVKIQSILRTILSLEQFNSNYQQIITIQRYCKGKQDSVQMMKQFSSSLLLQRYYRNYFKDIIILRRQRKAAITIQKFVTRVEQICLAEDDNNQVLKEQLVLQNQLNYDNYKQIPFCQEQFETELILSNFLNSIKQMTQEEEQPVKAVTFDVVESSVLSELQLSNYTQSKGEKKQLHLTQPLQILGRSTSANKCNLKQIQNTQTLRSSSAKTNKFSQNRQKFLQTSNKQYQISQESMTQINEILSIEDLNPQQNTQNAHIIQYKANNIINPSPSFILRQDLKIFEFEINYTHEYLHLSLKLMPKNIKFTLSLPIKFAVAKIQQFYYKRFLFAGIQQSKIVCIQKFARSYLDQSKQDIVKWAVWRIQLFIVNNRKRQQLSKIIIMQAYLRQYQAKIFVNDMKYATNLIIDQYKLNILNIPTIALHNAIQTIRKHVIQQIFNKNQIKQIRAVLRIQTQYRKSLTRSNFIRQYSATIIIQSIFRQKLVRNFLEKVATLSKLIQRKYAPQIQVSNRTKQILNVWNLSTIIIQKQAKVFLLQKKFIQQELAVNFINKIVKGYLQRRMLKYQIRSCQIIVCKFRGHEDEKKEEFQKIQQNSVTIQRIFRFFINCKIMNKQIWSVSIIRKNWMKVKEQKQDISVYNAVQVIQSSYRQSLSVWQLESKQKALNCIQKVTSGYLQRTWYLKQIESTLNIQAAFRGFVERKRLQQKHQLCLLIQNQFQQIYERNEESEDSQEELHTFWLNVEPDMRNNVYLSNIYKKNTQRARINQIRSRQQ